MPGMSKEKKAPEDPKAPDGSEDPDGLEDSEAPDGSEDPKVKEDPGRTLAKLGEELGTLDHSALAEELASFYESEEKKRSLSEAGITFNPSSKEELGKKYNKQIGQIVVSTQKEGLPDIGTPLIIFSSNSIQAPKISGEGLNMEHIEKIQQEHFINFLQFQADKAKKSKEADENSQPITIEAVGFSPESLNKLLDQIKSNPDIAQNIRIELPEFDKCVHGDGKKYTQKEYDAAQKQIKALPYTAPSAKENPVDPGVDPLLKPKAEEAVADEHAVAPKSPKKK